MEIKDIAKKHKKRWYPMDRMNKSKLRSFKRLQHKYKLVELSGMLNVEVSILSRYRSGELVGKRL